MAKMETEPLLLIGIAAVVVYCIHRIFR